MSYTFHFGEVLRYWDWLLFGMANTLAFSLVAMAAGLVIGIVGAVWRNSRHVALRMLAAAYVEAIRNTPLLVQLFIVFFALPAIGIRLSTSAAAALALTINNGAYMTEIVRAGIDNVHRSQREAAASLGLTRWQTFHHIVLAQAIERIYPALVSQFILLMLSSSLISAIGAEDLTAFCARIQSENFRAFEIYLVCGALYLVLTFALRGGLGVIGLLIFRRRRALARA